MADRTAASYDRDHSGVRMGWLEAVEAGAREMRLAPGAAVFRQGDPARAVFRVDSGRVRLVRTLSDGASVGLHVAQPGETFAEASLFATAYHCDAVSETASTVTAFDSATIRRRFAENPHDALAFAASLAGQVRDLRARLELRNIRRADDRLEAWLRLNAGGDPPVVELSRPWREVATEIGLTHEALYRALADLQRDGRLRRPSPRRVRLSPGGA